MLRLGLAKERGEKALLDELEVKPPRVKRTPEERQREREEKAAAAALQTMGKVQQTDTPYTLQRLPAGRFLLACNVDPATLPLLRRRTWSGSSR